MRINEENVKMMTVEKLDTYMKNAHMEVQSGYKDLSIIRKELVRRLQEQQKKEGN